MSYINTFLCPEITVLWPFPGQGTAGCLPSALNLTWDSAFQFSLHSPTYLEQHLQGKQLVKAGGKPRACGCFVAFPRGCCRKCASGTSALLHTAVQRPTCLKPSLERLENHCSLMSFGKFTLTSSQSSMWRAPELLRSWPGPSHGGALHTEGLGGWVKAGTAFIGGSSLLSRCSRSQELGNSQAC